MIGHEVYKRDTLVARITPCLENGKTAYVDFLKNGEVGWGSTEYIVLHSKPPLPPEYAYFLARSDNFRAFAIQNMTVTSGRQRAPTTAFDSYQMVAPPTSIAKQFGDVAFLILATMKQRDEEAQTLAIIRGMLLPRLLSGEIRVGEAEKAVEMAL